MIFIVYSATGEQSIERSLGAPEYSYYFVLKEFLPVLRKMGIVVRVTDPEREVDEIYRNSLAHGEDCIFLSFAPPHKTTLGLECPTIPVFAWEFGTIPDETWVCEPRNDWSYVFRQLGRGITHSNFSRNLISSVAGQNFDIESIPAPVWDRFATKDRSRRLAVGSQGVDFLLRGRMIDSRCVDLSIYESPKRRAEGHAPLPSSATDLATYRLHVQGVVYTSVFNPEDGRKNWFDMLNAFCWAFRDIEDATLILKLTHTYCAGFMSAILEELYKCSPIKCRVIVIDGYLDDADYEKLAVATTYVVNTAHGEGQCLPLMEYMSLGKPAVAPRHTAMLDYVDEENSFVIDSSLEPAFWPQDERGAIRTLRHRIDFESLLAAYEKSYLIAKNDPDRYSEMGDRAREALRLFCSHEVIERKLRAFLKPVGSTSSRGVAFKIS